MVNANCHVFIRIESLRLENEVTTKVRVTPQSAKTFYDITRIILYDFATLHNLPTCELWPSRQLSVDDSIELFRVFVRQIEGFTDLSNIHV